MDFGRLGVEEGGEGLEFGGRFVVGFVSFEYRVERVSIYFDILREALLMIHPLYSSRSTPARYLQLLEVMVPAPGLRLLKPVS